VVVLGGEVGAVHQADPMGLLVCSNCYSVVRELFLAVPCVIMLERTPIRT
jgi:hypothetical protein